MTQVRHLTAKARLAAAERQRKRRAAILVNALPSQEQPSTSAVQLNRRSRETPEQRTARLDKLVTGRQLRNSRETSEQRAIRLSQAATALRERRTRETSEQRAIRLSQAATALRERHTRETAERRATRLNQLAIAQQERRSREILERHSTRLNQVVEVHLERICMETPDERTARLNQLTVAREIRHNLETPDERVTRMAQLVAARQERQRVETTEQRTTRLQLLRTQREELFQRNSTVLQQRRHTHRGVKTYLQACDVSCEVERNNLGCLNVTCVHCHALSFKGETVHCCSKGKINLEPYQRPTSTILSLLDNTHRNSAAFLRNIRLYNTALSFASLNGEQVRFPGRGPSTFQLHGSVYHRTSSIIPSIPERPAFAQLYFVDPDAALQERMRNRDVCNAELMTAISRELNSVSPLVQAYRQMHEIVMAEEASATAKPVRMWMLQRARDDPRRYNAPTLNQIAVVIDTPDGEIDRSRGVSVYSRHQPGSHNISTTSPLLDALLYPVFFPYGDSGWTHNMPFTGREGTNRQNISMSEYYAYRLQVRSDDFNVLLRGRNLLQQFMVDVYTRVEGCRTNFLRLNQSALRVDQYQGLLDYVATRNQTEGPPGRAVLLPSSFTGGPRYLQQQYQDAMAMVIKKGRPDLFITFTTNPKWPEIVNSLLPGQNATSRPDIVARVFHLKVKALMHDITKKQIFGNVAAYSYSIEFQKRGLPHMHLLVILEGPDKIVGDPEIIDAIVQAEIPDPEDDSALHMLVKQHMMHGPCGADNPSSPCMQMSRNNIVQCQKRFPKIRQETTQFTHGSYPIYKRNGNVEVEKRGVKLDCRWVVPYNRYLLLKYEAHINVEICSSISCIKYLYKYFYKGHDRASVQISTTSIEGEEQPQAPYVHDEIQNYIDARYIAAPEAAWRLFSKKLCDKSHSVLLLAVHLPDQQTITFTVGQEVEATERAGETTLTAWFKLNQRTPSAREVRYTDIPEKYVFKAGTKEWQLRQRRLITAMARMPLISPTQGEKFYLRLLLLHVTGATSFENLRTVGNELKPTFRAAALARGLLESDNEWEAAMREAESFQMPRQLRNLFATILVYCAPQDPQGLWNMFADSMSQHLQPVERAKDIALAIIGMRVQRLGHSLAEYGFDDPTVEPQNEDSPVEVNTSEHLLLQLNTEQRQVVEAVLNTINTGKAECIFMDGPGGTGKTFVYNAIIQILSERQIKIKAVASTGIAATLLKGGQTAHSAFKLPVPTIATTTSSMTRFSPAGQSCIQSSVIIWDEAPMQHRHVFEATDRLFKDLMRNNLPFGGKTVLLGGDFRQILPVIRGGSRETCVGALITRSTLWQYFTIFKLTQNMRLADGESEFARELLRVGSGEANLPGTCNMPLPESAICPSDKNFVQEIFGDLVDNNGDLSSVAILCPHNEQSLLLNEDVLSILPGEVKRYLSTDTLESDEDGNNEMIPVEYLYELTPSGMPPHVLNIKIGAVIMLLRNMNIAGGMCNGTRLQVVQLMPHLIVAKLLVGPHAGEQVFLPRITLQPSDSELQIKFSRRQFPVRLSFAMTINKAQGQTFTKIGLCLRASVFSHGQLYVALSRSRKQSNVIIRTPLNQTSTRNIVYTEALL